VLQTTVERAEGEPEAEIEPRIVASM